jgi:hypothetical protein
VQGSARIAIRRATKCTARELEKRSCLGYFLENYTMMVGANGKPRLGREARLR